ncbi:protein phosphatase PHLPP-like protein isoform X2 [Chelonus insularis]|nr:protein phosphatase PHLPP-like protein isoform X2 [Chelonus insularis]
MQYPRTFHSNQLQILNENDQRNIDVIEIDTDNNHQEGSELYFEYNMNSCSDNCEHSFDSQHKKEEEHEEIVRCKLVNTYANEKKQIQLNDNESPDKLRENTNQCDSRNNNLNFGNDHKISSTVGNNYINTNLSMIEQDNENDEDEYHQKWIDSSFRDRIDHQSQSGWIRIHTGTKTRLFQITINTTVEDVCRDMLSCNEISLYVQHNGVFGQRLAPNDKPLEYQEKFLQHLGYEDSSKRARLGVDPKLRHLITFYAGPSAPEKNLKGYNRCGFVWILKGLVTPQWKKRVLVVVGSGLFLHSENSDSQAEWIELEGGSICYAPSRFGKFVLRVTGYPMLSRWNSNYNSEQRPCNRETISANGHHENKHLYLGFDHSWTRELWRGWLKQAIETSDSKRKLDLSNSSVTRIPNCALAFSEIQEIHLGYNLLEDDDNNFSILKRFPSLQMVYLKHNKLSTIPTVLIEMKGLTTLDISENKIEEIPTEIYQLINLKELILDRNKIKNLPVEIELLKELRNLSLADNLFTDLPPFLKMRALTVDMLTKNESNKIKDEKNNHAHLQRVNLRNNQLKGNIILGNYGNLTHLDVSENNIEKLDISALSELQSARCARNSLTELILCGKNLISLIAGHNKLKKLIIEPTPIYLEHLDMSYNSLDGLPEWISDLPNLHTLFASHNDLTFLPDKLLSQPSSLEVLDLSHNRLQSLPSPKKPLNIVHLTLQDNALKTLPTTFFQYTERIKVLNLSNNRLSELVYNDQHSKSRSNTHNLEKLYLTANCLTDTALDALAKFPALRILHLAYNVLDTLPESCIAAWSDLEELVLSGNRLQYLPDNISSLQHLRVLRVHSNRLLTCPTFNKTTSLMVVDLAHNQLNQVNLATLVPPQLQFLDISCNSKLHVDPRQFQAYRSQRPVSLIDVSGQNRSSIPFHPFQQEIIDEKKKAGQPWKLGFSETAGTREKLFISQVRLPSFCNTEGLFGIFDGCTNQEAPNCLQEIIPRLVLEEKTIKETSKDYLKYTLLSAHQELKERGQKYGVDSTLIHIVKLNSSQSHPRVKKKYCLKVASSGETKAVLCRAAGPLVLAPFKKPSPNLQMGENMLFPYVMLDPVTEDIILEEDDEFVIIASKKLWEVMTIQEAVREVRAEANSVLAAKRLQDLAQAYGVEDNISVIVIRFTNFHSGDLDQLMKELRHVVSKNRNQLDNDCSCLCCAPSSHHKSLTYCCCHANNGESYLNGILKNIMNRPEYSRPRPNRFFKNSGVVGNSSPPFRDDRSSPSGQSDQTTDSTFKSKQSIGKPWIGNTASRAASKNRTNVIKNNNFVQKDNAHPENSGPMNEEQFRCWEYMLEQNTHMLFNKELDTLTRLPLKRGQSRSTPHLANIPFLSKRFGSARSFHPPLPRASVMRFGSGRSFMNGGPNAAYFGSLQRLMPYNLEYNFAVIQERAGLDSLEQDSSRMQQYWGVATTEL